MSSETQAPTVLVPKKVDKTWHTQQAKILKDWAEIASSYRWMHYQAYMRYKKSNMWYMIPLIIMSTVTGTANFAQNSFPVSIRSNVPQIIGAINLFSAILTTIYQFLKISEFMEAHRISSIHYGKLARSIAVELNIPVKDRETGGAETVKRIRGEIDRLIEQSPTIPGHVLIDYETQFSNKGLCEPEIIVINKVDVYDDPESKVTNVLTEAGMKLKSLLKKPASPFTRNKELVGAEMETLSKSKLVSSLSNFFKQRKSPKQPLTPPVFPESPKIEEITEPLTINTQHMPSPSVSDETSELTATPPPERTSTDDDPYKTKM